jgi:hypothetical protein
MPCSTVSSLAVAQDHLHISQWVWITCPPILKSSNPSRASLIRYSLYKLNRICDKQQPCLTPIPIFTLLVSPWSSRTLTLCSMYNLLINLLSRRSVPVSCNNNNNNHGSTALYMGLGLLFPRLLGLVHLWQSVTSPLAALFDSILMWLPDGSGSQSGDLGEKWPLNFAYEHY